MTTLSTDCTGDAARAVSSVGDRDACDGRGRFKPIPASRSWKLRSCPSSAAGLAAAAIDLPVDPNVSRAGQLQGVGATDLYHVSVDADGLLVAQVHAPGDRHPALPARWPGPPADPERGLLAQESRRPRRHARDPPATTS